MVQAVSRFQKELSLVKNWIEKNDGTFVSASETRQGFEIIFGAREEKFMLYFDNLEGHRLEHCAVGGKRIDVLRKVHPYLGKVGDIDDFAAWAKSIPIYGKRDDFLPYMLEKVEECLHR